MKAIHCLLCEKTEVKIKKIDIIIVHENRNENSVIRATTGAPIGEVILTLNKKPEGIIFRVPVDDVPVVDLTVKLNTDATCEDVKKAMKAPDGSMKGFLGYIEEVLVTVNIIGNTHWVL